MLDNKIIDNVTIQVVSLEAIRLEEEIRRNEQSIACSL
jgi:hypothetical protein